MFDEEARRIALQGIMAELHDLAPEPAHAANRERLHAVVMDDWAPEQVNARARAN